MTRNGLKFVIKEILKQSGHFTTGRKYVVVYAISGLEQIEQTDHKTKDEAMQAARNFLSAYNGPGSKKAGEKIVKIDNGYIIKDASNATVGIATVIEPRGTGAGDQFQQQNEVANPTESMFPTLSNALDAIEDYLDKNKVIVDPSEHDKNEQSDRHGIRGPFQFGGIPYETNKDAHYKLLSVNAPNT